MAPSNPLYLGDTMHAIAETAWNCLEQTSTGKPNDFFVSHNAPAADCCDMVVVYADYIRPSVGFGDARYVTGSRIVDKCCTVGRVADLVIELWRPCYPGPTNNANGPFPPAADMDAASRALAEDAWVLQCCLTEAHCAGNLIQSSPGECLEIAWGDMVPLGPEGGCAGWKWLITIELENCGC